MQSLSRQIFGLITFHGQSVDGSVCFAGQCNAQSCSKLTFDCCSYSLNSSIQTSAVPVESK